MLLGLCVAQGHGHLNINFFGLEGVNVKENDLTDQTCMDLETFDYFLLSFISFV